MSSQQIKKQSKNTRRVILSLLLFIFLVCFAGRKQATLASLFASLPFTIPLFVHKSLHNKRKTMLSVIYGLAGIVLSVLISKQSDVKLFLSAFAGISVFLLNEFAFKKLEKSKQQTAFSLSFLVLFMVCYL